VCGGIVGACMRRVHSCVCVSVSAFRDAARALIRLARTNKCIVGEVDGRAVGLMAVTSDVELPVLQKVR
jgi:hypothetical protein